MVLFIARWGSLIVNRMVVVGSIVLFWCFTAKGQDPVDGGNLVTRDPQGHLILNIKCNQFTDALAALRRWTAARGERLGPEPIPELRTGGYCALDIQDSVPEFARQLHGRRPAFNGPNCFNTALVLTGVLPGLRYVTDNEVHLWLESPLCRALSANEPPLPGDLIQIRHRRQGGQGGEIQEDHSFIYVGDNVVFSKNGFERRHPFAIQTLDNVFNVYEIYGFHNPCRRMVAVNPPECTDWANYYRCQNLDDYLASQQGLQQRLAPLVRLLSDIECQVDEVVVQPWANTLRVSDLMRSSLEIVEELARPEQTAAQNAQNRTEEALWSIILARVASVRVQISNFRRGHH